MGWLNEAADTPSASEFIWSFGAKYWFVGLRKRGTQSVSRRWS